MLDVRRLRLLRELALRGTIAAVAEALSYSPSAVSQQLGTLEREAGVPLLERTGRRVTLTPAAHALVGHTEAVLERLERAAAELVDARSGPAGTLRVGAFPSAAGTLLPAALAELGRVHPRLEPMLSEMDPACVDDALRGGDLDVALVHDYAFVSSSDEPGVDSESLFSEPMYLASAGADDRAAVDGPLLARWRDAAWITALPGTLCHTMTMRACEAAGFTPHVRHRVDEFTSVLALVAAGQGVAVVPHLATAAGAHGVTLTPLPMRRRTRIAYRRGAAAHPAVTAFTAVLRAAVPAGALVAEPPPVSSRGRSGPAGGRPGG